MDLFITVFLAQFLFGSVFFIELITLSCVSAGSSAGSGASLYYGKYLIQLYINENVGPFKPCESILKEAVFGDLIEFDRKKSYFNHWAIFIGNGKVADPSVLDIIETCDIFDNMRSAMVFFKDLTDVAGSDNCRVNNKVKSVKNRRLKPRSEKEIMESVLKSQGKGINYNILDYNCEHKVTEWKFGLPFSDQADAIKGTVTETLKTIDAAFPSLCDACLEASASAAASPFTAFQKIVEYMVDEDVGQFLNPELVRNEAKRYDIIEIKRMGYSHYAIYVGKGYVMHLSHDYNIFGNIYETRNGQISRELLINVAGKDLCRVNNKKRSAKRRGLVPQEPQQIQRYLDGLENTKVDYSIYSYNCEHIVTQLKFGKAFSDQVDAIENIAKETAKTAKEVAKLVVAYLLTAYTGKPFEY